MKTKLFAGLCGALLLGAGCVETVNEKSTAGVPFIKDRVEGRYDRPMDEVFGAAKKVVNNLGTLVNESTFYNQNTAVRTIEGKINQRNVYIRIESVDPKMCNCIVQARTRAGGVDVELAHYIDKEIALGLK